MKVKTAFPRSRQKVTNMSPGNRKDKGGNAAPDKTRPSIPKESGHSELVDMEPKEFLKAHQIHPKMYGLDLTKGS